MKYSSRNGPKMENTVKVLKASKKKLGTLLEMNRHKSTIETVSLKRAQGWRYIEDLDEDGNTENTSRFKKYFLITKF